METAENVRFLFAVALLIVGLSHIVQGEAWAAFFKTLASRGDAGALANALIHMAPGLIIIGFHPVYSWPGVLFTLLGWAWVIKAAVYMVAPGVGVRQMTHGADKTKITWLIAGSVMVFVALLLAFSLYWR